MTAALLQAKPAIGRNLRRPDAAFGRDLDEEVVRISCIY